MLSLFTYIVISPLLFFWWSSLSFDSKFEYLAWIFSSGQFWSIIYEKKPNFGLIALNTDLKVGTDGVDKQSEETKDPRGSFKLLLRRPVTPISLVDSSEGLVFREDMVLIIVASSSWRSISKDRNIL